MNKRVFALVVALAVISLSCAIYAGEIHNIVFSGKSEMVKAYLDKNPQALNEKGLSMGIYDWTPLHIAAKRGNLDIVQLLIERGAELNALNSMGQTPLFLAVQGGHKDIANLLIERGAIVRIKDKFDKTPLDWADTQEMKDLLTRSGAQYHQEAKFDCHTK